VATLPSKEHANSEYPSGLLHRENYILKESQKEQRQFKMENVFTVVKRPTFMML